jgi:lipopolysaccharide transport system ATP-binding protein
MTAIRVEHLSKKYTIGAAQARHTTLRDVLADTAMHLNPIRKKHKAEVPANEIWALDDISFEIQRGEVVGVIGRNGAGKSTLLKILAHITPPTRGRVEIHGRVGSLLEVGTGFHSELTGRENIYLNGAILGMTRAEINRKFDEIVAFAEIEKFLDTPVKHYSSGMYMRLAFAVAAHLEPEILLVDEVLAVGDAAFQKKCLGKMGEVAHEGRTVLFVSHNMAAISKLCQSCMLINQGKIASIGSPDGVVKQYLESVSDENNHWHDRSGSHRVKIDRIDILDADGQKNKQITMGDPMVVHVMGHAESSSIEFTGTIQLVAPDGIIVLYASDQYAVLHAGSGNTFSARFCIDELLLMPGDYYVSVWIGKEGIEELDFIRNAAKISVSTGGNLPITHSLNTNLGYVFTKVRVEDETIE